MPLSMNLLFTFFLLYLSFDAVHGKTVARKPPLCPPSLPALTASLTQVRDDVTTIVNSIKTMTDLRTKVNTFFSAKAKSGEGLKNFRMYQKCIRTPPINAANAQVIILADAIGDLVEAASKGLCSSLPEFEAQMNASKANVESQLANLQITITMDQFNLIKNNISSESKFVKFFSRCYPKKDTFRPVSSTKGLNKLFAQVPKTEAESVILLRQAKYLLVRTYIHLVSKYVNSVEKVFTGQLKAELTAKLGKVQAGFEFRIQQLQNANIKLKAQQIEKERIEAARLEKLRKEREEKQATQKEKQAEAAAFKQAGGAVKEASSALRQTLTDSATLENTAIEYNAPVATDLAVTDTSSPSSGSTSLSTSLTIALVVIGSVVLLMLIIVQVQLFMLYRRRGNVENQ